MPIPQVRLAGRHGPGAVLRAAGEEAGAWVSRELRKGAARTAPDQSNNPMHDHLSLPMYGDTARCQQGWVSGGEVWYVVAYRVVCGEVG